MEGGFPNASGHDPIFGAGSLFLDRPVLSSFQGLAGQLFSGVAGTAAFSSRFGWVALAVGATRVDECS